MTLPLRLKAAGEWLTLSQLKDGQLPARLSSQEENAIQFCRGWLNGQEDFGFETSGSTGKPKSIVFTRAQLEASALLTCQALHLKPGYSVLVCLDTKFIAGAMMLVRSMVIGMDMVIETPSVNPLNSISEPVDFVALVPYQLSTILERTPAVLNNVKIVIVGGAPMEKALIPHLEVYTSQFYATYGMTETITHVALQKLNGPDKQDCFQFLPGVHASTDNRGCLVIKASHLGPLPVVTNDLVTILNETTFLWIGRFDATINSGGIKVQAGKVEHAAASALRQLEIRRRFFVRGSFHSKLGEQVTLYVEGYPLNQDQEQDLHQHMTGYLHPYELPKLILYVPKFVETSTQKVDRVATQKLAEAC